MKEKKTLISPPNRNWENFTTKTEKLNSMYAAFWECSFSLCVIFRCFFCYFGVFSFHLKVFRSSVTVRLRRFCFVGGPGIERKTLYTFHSIWTFCVYVHIARATQERFTLLCAANSGWYKAIFLATRRSVRSVVIIFLECKYQKKNRNTRWKYCETHKQCGVLKELFDVVCSEIWWSAFQTELINCFFHFNDIYDEKQFKFELIEELEQLIFWICSSSYFRSFFFSMCVMENCVNWKTFK